MRRSVAILSGVRTAIGKYGGSLSAVPPCDLASLTSEEAIARSGISAEYIGQTILGNVIHTAPEDMYISRVAAIRAGVPVGSPALSINRLCGSGLQAVISAAEQIILGNAAFALAGGAESMSRAGHLLSSGRFGAKMGDLHATDMMLGALTDPFGNGHMGMTAENIAAQSGVSRESQDEYALQSHARAASAIKEGRFSDQILPIKIGGHRKTAVFDTDEHVRSDLSLTDLKKLRPAFRREGTVTAGNSSGLNDGGAALVLADEDQARAEGLKPMARIIGYGLAGVKPELMGLGPIFAVKEALKKTGLSISDFDCIESNEAFAAQACVVASELAFPVEKVNPNGGAIALGHPLGASGAILLVKLLYELERIKGRLGLVTMCIGGGQGIALIVEREV